MGCEYKKLTDPHFIRTLNHEIAESRQNLNNIYIEQGALIIFKNDDSPLSAINMH